MCAAPVHTAFEHQALLYDGLEDLVAQAAASVREGLALDEPVLVVMTSDRLEAVREELGEDAGRVQLADMALVGRNPGRIIPALQRFVDEQGDGVAVRVVGEPIWAGRPGDELVECQRTEALLNVAFGPREGLRLLCLYDRSALGADVLHEARCSHPVVVEDGVASPSPDLRAADAASGELPPLPPPPGGFDVLGVERRTLREARALVARRASEAGLAGWRVQDAVRAVHELAANSVRHGGGKGVLRIWRADDALVCEVRDRGHIADPLAGRRRPAPDATTGRGLWIATQVSDLLQIRTGPSGSAVRLVMRLG